MHIKAPLLVIREKSAIDGLFNPHQPWPDGMDGKGNVLRFNIGEGRPVQIADHVRRHTKDAADFRNLELSRFQELRFVVGQAQRNERHSLFQHSHAAGVAGAAIGSVPAGPQSCRVFDGVRVCQDTRWPGTVGEELASVFLGGNAKADGAFLQRNGTVPDNTVKAEAGHMQHLSGIKCPGLTIAGGVGVGQVALAVPIHLHVIRQQRVQAVDLGASRADDLAVAIPVEQQVRHHGFTPDERGHFQIRLVMEQAVQRMIHGLPTAFIRGFIHMEGQAGDGFGDHAHAGVNGRNLNGRAGADRLAGTAHTEVKAWRGGYGVLGLVPRPKQI